MLMFLRILVLVGSIAGLLTTIDNTTMSNGGHFSFSDQSGIWIVLFSIIYYKRYLFNFKEVSPLCCSRTQAKPRKDWKNLKKIRKNYSEKINWKK